VDGAPAPLWRANYAFQAVEVPEGKHDVLLTYKDKALRMGGIISLVSALVCVGGWMFLPGAAGRETAN
jgi:uncharacterized membrane protein YfhO